MSNAPRADTQAARDPLSAHGAWSSMGAMPSCVAPAAASNAAVPFPCWILFTRPLFATASTGHFVSAPPGDPAAPASTTAAAGGCASDSSCLGARSPGSSTYVVFGHPIR